MAEAVGRGRWKRAAGAPRDEGNSAGINLPGRQRFCPRSHGRRLVPGYWGPAVVAESVSPPNIEGVEGSGMDVLDHSPEHGRAGAAPAAGLGCVERLVNAKENMHPIELSLVLPFPGCRTVIHGDTCSTYFGLKSPQNKHAGGTAWWKTVQLVCPCA